MSQPQKTVNDVVFSRLSIELGNEKARRVEAEVHRDILLEENRLLRAKLDELKQVEQGEGGDDSEPIEEGE